MALEKGNNSQDIASMILELCECSICAETLSKCIVTKCGHSFCEKCIMSSLNRNNYCPQCKYSLDKESLNKNYLVDNIVSCLEDYKDRLKIKDLENRLTSFKLGLSSDFNDADRLVLKSIYPLIEPFLACSSKIKENFDKSLQAIKIEEENLLKTNVVK